jgi:hypothetical protein
MANKDELRKAAFSAGLPRAEAWVLAALGFWSQAKGGVVIQGETWRWRDASEVADETCLSKRTVSRVIGALKVGGLIRVRRIWHPMKPGKNVNAFIVTQLGMSKLQTTNTPKGHNQSGHPVSTDHAIPASSTMSSAPVGTGHEGAIMNSVLPTEKSKKPAAVSQVGEMAAELPEWTSYKCFNQEEWEIWTEETVESFWNVYKRLVRERFEYNIGSSNKQRIQWMNDYLGIFKEEALGPIDAIMALLVAMDDWSNFSIELAAAQGKSEWLCKSHPDPYDLGMFGNVFFHFFKYNHSSSDY